MTSENIVQLLNMMDVRNIKPRQGWVMATCPFAEALHEGGKDNRPSFGISVRGSSGYNCFTCGMNGRLMVLAQNLHLKTGKYFPEIHTFIMRYEGFEPDEFEDLSEGERTAPILPASALKMFSTPPGKVLNQLGIHSESVVTEQLLWDGKSTTLLFPIFDKHNRMIAIRGRYMGTNPEMPRYRLMHSGDGPKTFGVWYGIHRPSINGTLFVVEGERDRVLLLQSGVRKAAIWASMGAQVSRAQLKTLRESGASQVILFTDNDKPGQALADKIIQNISGVLTYKRITEYLDCKDPAEIVQAGKIKAVLRNAGLI